jgi:hypothetical protein
MISNAEQEFTTTDPEELCQEFIDDFRNKAAHNKKESIVCIWLTIGGASVAPFFVTLGADLAGIIGLENYVIVFSKIIPTIISISVAISATWLQVRKPQQLWALYRTAQRNLEHQLYQYKYKVSHFEKAENSKSIFVEKIIEIRNETHNSWLNLIPNLSSDNNK